MANKSSSKQETHFTEQLLKKSYIHNVVDWSTRNLKNIGIVAGVIVLLLVMIFSWLTYKKSMNESAAVLEGDAFKAHQEAQEAAGSQSPSEDTAEEASSTPQDSYQKASGLYQKILDEYPGTKSAERALYLLGSIEFELGNYESAQEYFSSYRSKYPKGILLNSAEESLGYILEQQQEYQQALDMFKGLENKVDAGKKTEMTLAIARNYELLDQVDDAIATYQTIVDSDTSFSLKNQAKERLDFLKAQQRIASTVSEPVEIESKQEEIKAEPVSEIPETTETTTEETPAETPVASSETTETPAVTAEEAASETPVETTETAETPTAAEEVQQSETPVESTEATETPTGEEVQPETSAETTETTETSTAAEEVQPEAPVETSEATETSTAAEEVQPEAPVETSEATETPTAAEEVQPEIPAETTETTETTTEEIQAAETPTEAPETTETSTVTEEEPKIDSETTPTNEENKPDEKGTGSN